MTAEEDSRRGSNSSKTSAERLTELRLIIQDIRKLLLHIEDAVPLINLAITTSGASLSTNLPASVSPSRLLQASTFLTAGDAQFSMDPNTSVPVGPAFVLSMYMLFSGHTQKADDNIKGVRHTKWKEAIHKARVKLVRIPLATVYGAQNDSSAPSGFSRVEDTKESFISSEGKTNEFAYQLEIIEDLDDDRVHSYEEGEPQPGPCGGVELAGIRETIPIHQISKIFYANTGRILNIGNDEGPNSPVLLLKRDLNAQFPRKFMERSEQEYMWHEEQEGAEGTEFESEDSQWDIDRQLQYESSVNERDADISPPGQHRPWCFPPNLDPEWLAFEVYTEADDDSSDDSQDTGNDSAYVSGRASSSTRKSPVSSDFANVLSKLHLGSPKPQHMSQSSSASMSHGFSTSALGPIRTSLSLLEVLIRLTSLQQFQQSSHLAISDELLTFFLEDSSSTGAGGDREERRRTRMEATQKVGFDPYSDSPEKTRDGQRHRDQGNEAYEDGYEPATPHYDYEPLGSPGEMPRWSRERSGTPPQNSPDWLLQRERRSNPRQTTPDVRSSPQSPQSPITRSKASQPVMRIQQSRGLAKAGSPLGRGAIADTDSSLGTSPGSLSPGATIMNVPTGPNTTG